MTIDDAAELYDVSIYRMDNLWYWDINGGYPSVGGHNGYADIKECEQELIKFLETFKPFEK